MTVTSTNRMVRGSIFEGLFMHGVPQSDELTAALRAKGFDSSQMQAEYTAQVFNACLEAARTHLHPGVSPADGHRALGEAQVAGLRQTLVGKVVLSGIHLVTPSRLMKMTPRLFQVDSTPVKVTPLERGPTSWVVAFVGDPTMHPDYISGIISGLLKLKGLTSVCRARTTSPGDFEVEVSWS